MHGLRIDPCTGPLDSLCQVGTSAVGGVAQVGTDVMLGGLGKAFVSAAESVSTTAFTAVDASTRVDLSAAWFTRNVAVIAAVTLPVVVALFVAQVLSSVLRREPGGLGRALLGVGQATLGSALAVAVTGLALVACDEVCAVIAASAGTTVPAAASRFLSLAWLSGSGPSPVLQMLLAMAVIVGSLLLWAVLLFRKAALLLVAVFAPVAFAGSVWDHTRVWRRRWVETVVALVFCKVVIVVVFVLGLAAFGSDGTTTPSAANTVAGVATTSGSSSAALSDLLVGLLLLGIAVFAPWLTFRFVHWSGAEAGAAVAGAMAASPIPGAVRSAGRTTRMVAQTAATSSVLGAAGGAAASRGAGAAAGAGGSSGAGASARPVAMASMLTQAQNQGGQQR